MRSKTSELSEVEKQQRVKAEVTKWYNAFLELERRYGSSNLPGCLRRYFKEARSILEMERVHLGRDENSIVIRELKDVPSDFLTDVNVGRNAIAFFIRADRKTEQRRIALRALFVSRHDHRG